MSLVTRKGEVTSSLSFCPHKCTRNTQGTNTHVVTLLTSYQSRRMAPKIEVESHADAVSQERKTARQNLFSIISQA